MTICGRLTGVCGSSLKVPGTTNVLPVASSKARSKLPEGISQVSAVASIIKIEITTNVLGMENFLFALFSST